MVNSYFLKAEHSRSAFPLNQEVHDDQGENAARPNHNFVTQMPLVCRTQDGIRQTYKTHNVQHLQIE
jgi:hypothetical protein